MAAILSQELPIMGYSGFPVTTVNEMRYIEAKECGLTALMQSFTTAADARRCLDMAQKTGIKLLLSNHIIFQKDGREIAKAVKGHHSNLAYGAQGLWYYNYKKGPVPPAKMFSQGHPIAPDGRRSTVYERMRRVNNEFQDRAFVFLGAKVDKVSHTGKAIPLGTKRLSLKELPSWVRKLETPDGGAVVSQLTNNGKNYLVVVNRSPDKELTLKLDLIKGVKRVRYDGSVVDASLYTNEFWLDPGMAEIFQAP